MEFINWLLFYLRLVDAFTCQPSSPIRAEVDVKLGGTQCNLIISRLKPWLRFHFSKKKRMVLRDEVSATEKAPVSDVKPIMWTCTLSAPEMTIILYSLNGLPLYHVSIAINRLPSCFIYVCVHE